MAYEGEGGEEKRLVDLRRLSLMALPQVLSTHFLKFI